MWRAISSSAWPSLEKAFASASPMPELPPVMTTRGSGIEQPSISLDAIADSGEPQRMPQRRLGRGDHRLAELLLEAIDDRMRACVEAGHDQAIGAVVEAAHAQLEQRVGVGFGQREAIGDAEAGAAHDLEAGIGEVAVLGLVDFL